MFNKKIVSLRIFCLKTYVGIINSKNRNALDKLRSLKMWLDLNNLFSRIEKIGDAAKIIGKIIIF